jgi:tetrahydromethanopterin S-methyltransferase subunit F
VLLVYCGNHDDVALLIDATDNDVDAVRAADDLVLVDGGEMTLLVHASQNNTGNPKRLVANVNSNPRMIGSDGTLSFVLEFTGAAAVVIIVAVVFVVVVSNPTKNTDR